MTDRNRGHDQPQAGTKPGYEQEDQNDDGKRKQELGRTVEDRIEPASVKCRHQRGNNSQRQTQYRRDKSEEQRRPAAPQQPASRISPEIVQTEWWKC